MVIIVRIHKTSEHQCCFSLNTYFRFSKIQEKDKDDIFFSRDTLEQKLNLVNLLAHHSCQGEEKHNENIIIKH